MPFVYDLPKENLTAIMMLYNNTEAMDFSPVEDTDVVNTLIWIFPGDMLAPYLLIHCLDDVLRRSTELIKGFHIKNRKGIDCTLQNLWYNLQMTAYLINALTQKKILYRLQQAVGGVSLYMNANKAEYISFQ